MLKNKKNLLNWEDYMVILIALEDHQAVLQNVMYKNTGRRAEFAQCNILKLTPLRRKLHAMRDALD